MKGQFKILKQGSSKRQDEYKTREKKQSKSISKQDIFVYVTNIWL